jgi:hypothetical protein
MSTPKKNFNIDKKSSSRFRNIKSKSQSPFWKNLKPCRRNIKINGLPGSKRLYYQWDYTHQEIEMYDYNGLPVDALDPITGNNLFKDG